MCMLLPVPPGQDMWWGDMEQGGQTKDLDSEEVCKAYKKTKSSLRKWKKKYSIPRQKWDRPSKEKKKKSVYCVLEKINQLG